MNYATAYEFILAQGLPSAMMPDALLVRLRQGQPPIPGQITSLLLALKVTQDALRPERHLERRFVHALYRLATESRDRFNQGQRQGIEWPPLLDADLNRIQQSVDAIFAAEPGEEV